MERRHPVPSFEESFLRFFAFTRRSQKFTDNSKVRAASELSCVMRISDGISGLIADGWHGRDSFVLSKPRFAWTIRQIPSTGCFIVHGLPQG